MKLAAILAAAIGAYAQVTGGAAPEGPPANVVDLLDGGNLVPVGSLGALLVVVWKLATDKRRGEETLKTQGEKIERLEVRVAKIHRMSARIYLYLVKAQGLGKPVHMPKMAAELPDDLEADLEAAADTALGLELDRIEKE